MRMSVWTNLKRKFSVFNGDRSGMALIYITITLPVIISLGVLAVDLGRLATLQSSLQHGADALALAGAGELDRRPDAIARANLAIANLVTSNVSLFGASVVTIDETAVTVRYFSAIPGHGANGTDADAMPAGSGLNVATRNDNIAARFVEVTVTPNVFNTVLPASYYGGSNTRNVNATAVAGFDAAVCVYTPLFMCNPLEPAGNTDVYDTAELYGHVSSRAQMRRLIELKKHSGGNAQWSPGNFGYLEVPLGNGANALGEAIASGNPSSCIIQNTVSTKPGNTTVANDAFNVRFDLYKGQYSGNNSAYYPAKNARNNADWNRNPAGNIQGQSGACNINAFDPYPGAPASTTPAVRKATMPNMQNVAYGFPRDTCIISQTCTPNSRMGGGDWNGEYANYVSFNNLASVYSGAGFADTNSDRPSRYEAYKAELAAGIASYPLSHAVPACYSGTAAPATAPDRRIIYAVILNCVAQPIGSGAATGLVPAAYGKFFITEPMGSSQTSLMTELVGVDQIGAANSVAHDLVQLYR